MVVGQPAVLCAACPAATAADCICLGGTDDRCDLQLPTSEVPGHLVRPPGVAGAAAARHGCDAGAACAAGAGICDVAAADDRPVPGGPLAGRANVRADTCLHLVLDRSDDVQVAHGARGGRWRVGAGDPDARGADVHAG